MRNKVNGYSGLFWIICILISLASIFLTASYDTKNYAWILLLPCTFLIVSIFLLPYFNKIRHNVAALILYIGYLFRLAVAPLFFCLGGCNSFFPASVAASSVQQACFLMSGEFVTYLIVCFFWFRKKKRDNIEVLVDIAGFRSDSAGKIIIPIVLFLIATYVYIPALRTIYWPVFRANLSEVAQIYYDNDTIVSRGGIQRYLYSLFTFFWPITRAILPSVLILYVFKKKKRFIWAALCLAIPFFLLSGDNLAPIICCIVTLLVIARIYPSRLRNLLFVFFIFGIVFLLFVVPSKFQSMQSIRGDSMIATIGQMLQAYFPGFDNGAWVESLPKTNMLTTLFGDVYYTIPFRETLFGLSVVNLQERFSSFAGVWGQILPFSSQLHYYMPMPFVWVIMGYVFRLAISNHEKAKTASNFWRLFQYSYFSLFTAVSVTIYSASIYLRGLVNIYIPIVVIIYISGAFRRRHKGREAHVKI